MALREQPKDRLRGLFWACVVGFLALLVATVQRGFRGISDYSLDEWLIGYPGHFMRRGLRGSVVLELAKLTHLSALKIASCFVFGLYAVAAVLAITLVFRWLARNAPSFILPVLLSPAGIFFYFNAHNGGFRFDLVFVLVTIIHVELALRSRDYFRWAIVLFATLGVVAMLSSEVFLFVGIPINVFLCIRRLGRFDARTLVVFALPLITAAVCFARPGTVADGAKIYASSGLHPNIHSPVWFIGMSAGDAVKLVAEWTRTQGSSVLFLAIVGLTCAALLMVRRLLKFSEPETTTEANPLVENPWIGLWWIPFACSVPLYIIGYDWGRWAALVLAMFILTLCRVTRIVKPASLPAPLQFAAVAVGLVVGMPSHILAPASSLVDTNALGLVRTIARGGKPQSTAQTSGDTARQAASVYEALPATPADLMVAGDSIAQFGNWSEYLGVPAMNRGIYGDLSEGLAARVEELRRHHPKVLILIIGANDVRTGVPADVTVANIAKVAGIAPKCLVLGVLPGDPTILPPAYVKELDDALASAYGRNYVTPPAGWDWKLDTSDGLHPNVEGYKLISAEIRKRL